MKNEKTLKRLHANAKLSHIVGKIFIVLSILSVTLSLCNLVTDESMILVAAYIGSALSLLAFGAILLTVSSIAEYHTQE